jgi:hypothetical protein
MRYDEVKELIAKIALPGYQFVVFLKMGLTFLYMEPTTGTCNVTQEPMKWKSRKWYLSPHATPSEIVTTAFLCAKTAVEHELRENFTYKGQTVFDPHWDMDHIAVVISERAKP